jgi:hypothetical protein
MTRTARFGLAILPVLGLLLLGAAPAQAATTDPRPHPHRKPWPITVTVQTVPRLANVRLTFDGTSLTTNAAGRASITQEHNFGSHTLTLATPSLNLPTRQYRFARWAGQRDPSQAFRPSLTGLPMRADYTITAAFSVLYPVRPGFTDQSGHPLDLSRISSVTIKSDSGQTTNVEPNKPIWLTGQVPIYRSSTVVEEDVSYSLQSIMMDGTNIVDAGRQRFTPSTATPVTFVGQMHTLTVSANDAIYGAQVGDIADITYPDGTVLTVPFGPDHTATLTSVPRGTYTISVRGAHGIVMVEQVALSRDKAVAIGVLTTGDLLTIGSLGLAIAAALLFIGRLRRRTAMALQHIASALRDGVRWLRSRRWQEVFAR